MIKRIEEVLKAREVLRLSPPTEHTEMAGVLMMLKEQGGEPFVFFIKRAEDENDPFSGNMAFPGGRKDDGIDRDTLDTAIRETWEETGINLRAGGKLLGTLDDVWHSNSPIHHYLITPFVALAPPNPQIVLSHEVAEAVWVPLSVLRDQENRVTTLYEHKGIRKWAEGIRYRQYFIWGITGGIVQHFLSLIRNVYDESGFEDRSRSIKS